MGRYCKPLEVYLHRNSSDLPFVIAELARLSKHSEWLINPLRFLAQKNIRPMITHPLTMQLYYFELRVLLYRVLHVGVAREAPAAARSRVFQAFTRDDPEWYGQSSGAYACLFQSLPKCVDLGPAKGSNGDGIM